MKKRILVLATVLALVAAMIVPMAAIAGDNDATQSASTSKATTISVCAQDYSTVAGTITFPEGAPGAVVSTPYNNSDGTGSPQTLAAAADGKPVVTLVNTSAVAFKIWYNITAWTPADVVASESYVIVAKAAGCALATAIDNAVTFDTDTIDGDATTIAATGGDTAKKDLYLKISLTADEYGKSATSTLSILGETA